MLLSAQTSSEPRSCLGFSPQRLGFLDNSSGFSQILCRRLKLLTPVTVWLWVSHDVGDDD